MSFVSFVQLCKGPSFFFGCWSVAEQSCLCSLPVCVWSSLHVPTESTLAQRLRLHTCNVTKLPRRQGGSRHLKNNSCAIAMYSFLRHKSLSLRRVSIHCWSTPIKSLWTKDNRAVETRKMCAEKNKRDKLMETKWNTFVSLSQLLISVFEKWYHQLCVIFRKSL